MTRRDVAKYLDYSDVELILACQEHDPVAMHVLIRRQYQRISAMLFHLAPDVHDRADLMQEVLIRVWRSLPSLRNPFAFQLWLKRLVTNLAYSELRRRSDQLMDSLDRPIASYEEEEAVTREVPDYSALPDELSYRRELMKAIETAIEGLPSHFRQVITLRELRGLGYDEIALITCAEVGTVKSRLSRARKAMQNKLVGYLAG